MSASPEIANALHILIGQLLTNFEALVPEEGPFQDRRVKQQVYFGDSATSQPGVLELTVMSMDEQLDPRYKNKRFVAVRVKKSPRGGTVSATCFHGTKAELKAALEKERGSSTILLDRVQELASGLPEETNPNLWR